MQVRARRAFSSTYGMMRVGNIFSCEPGYASELLKLGMIEVLPDKHLPDRIQAHTTAPKIKGKVEPTENPPPSHDPNTADSADAGQVKPSSASRRGRASRQKT